MVNEAFNKSYEIAKLLRHAQDYLHKSRELNLKETIDKKIELIIDELESLCIEV